MRRSLLSPVLLSTTVLFVPVSAHSQSEPSVPSDAIVLDTIVVEGGITETAAGPVRGVRALTANSSTRTDTPIEEIPQNIQVITRELVEQQAAVTVTEALRNTSNVQPLDSRVIGNVEQAPYKIRGFPAELWIDGFPGSLFPAGDRDGLANVERIEILKGPNALLYGGGAGAPLGGVINIVSKLPEPTARYEAGATVGRYGYWSPFFDLNQPLNKDGTALFRITGEYTHDDSFIDVLQSDRYNINPTLTLTDNDQTSLTLQGFFSRHEQEAYQGLPYFGTITGDFRVRDQLYIGDPDIEPSVTEQRGVTATLDHVFNEVWSTNVKARFSRSGIDQFAQTPFLDATGTGGTPFLPPSLFDLNDLHHYSDQEEFAVSPTVQAKFDYGPSRNTLLFGGDYSRVADTGGMIGDTLGNFCFLSGGGCTPATVDLADPVFTTPFTRPEVVVGEGASFFDYDNTYITSGLFTQLQSTLYDRVHLLVGGRLASLDITYNENALVPPQSFITKETKFLPRAGGVVDLTDVISAYVGYSEGMRWVPFSQTFARPAPETSRSVEGGIKFNVSDTLTGTLAVFQIDRKNVPYQISFSVGGLSEQRSRGFEADVTYQATENWSVLASYGFTDAEFSTTVGATPAGRAVPMVPEHSGRLWVNYDFTSEALEGWSVGSGLYAASSQFLNATQDWKTDGYITFDAKVGYEDDRLRASLTAKNLAGEEYYTPYNWFGGQVAPGAPRSFYGQIAVKY